MTKKTVCCVDITGKTYEVPVSELDWRISAYGIIIKDNQLLVSKQFGKFDLPGGGVELGETLEEALVREVKEETGILVNNPQLINIEFNFFKFTHSSGKCAQCLMLYYKCDYKSGELSIEGFDEEEKKYGEMPEWFPLENLDNLTIASSVDYRPFVKKVAGN